MWAEGGVGSICLSRSPDIAMGAFFVPEFADFLHAEWVFSARLANPIRVIEELSGLVSF